MRNWDCYVFCSLPKGFWTVVAESIYQRSNLQTLCMKCNVGKSNKDSTDLRVEIEQSLKQT